MEKRLKTLRDQVRLDNMRRNEAGKARGNDGSIWQSGSSIRGSLYGYSKQSRNRKLKSTGHARFLPSELEKIKKRDKKSRKSDNTSSKGHSPSEKRGKVNGKKSKAEGGNLNTLMSLDAQVSRYRPSGDEGGSASCNGAGIEHPSHVTSTSSQPGRDLSGSPEEWSINDVTAWLSKVGMGQYQRTFEKNEIAGSILLDLDLGDLDYMSIKVLAHRKMLMKEIQKLKSTPKLDGAIQMTHWSHVQPLANRKVSGGTMTVNGADRVDQRVANAPGSGLIAMVKAEQRTESAGMWEPLAPAPEDSPSLAADSGGSGRGGCAGASWVFEGKMDEEAEHAAFRKAIEELRLGRGEVAKSDAEGQSRESKENIAIGVGTEASESSPTILKTKRSCYNCYKLHYEARWICSLR